MSNELKIDQLKFDELKFRCPVCHAGQSVRNACRRCRADLSLYADCFRRLLYLRDQYRQARQRDDRERQRDLFAELQQLSPTHAVD